MSERFVIKMSAPAFFPLLVHSRQEIISEMGVQEFEMSNCFSVTF
jgi:hypothetical protein